MTLTQRHERVIKDLETLSTALLNYSRGITDLESKVAVRRSVGTLQEAKGKVRLAMFDVEDAERNGR